MLNDEHIKQAAHCCYSPTSNPLVQSLILVVEELVLPSYKASYTMEDMQKYITSALEAAQQSVQLDGASWWRCKCGAEPDENGMLAD